MCNLPKMMSWDPEEFSRHRKAAKKPDFAEAEIIAPEHILIANP